VYIYTIPIGPTLPMRNYFFVIEFIKGIILYHSMYLVGFCNTTCDSMKESNH
jgi:hypothetical protein